MIRYPSPPAPGEKTHPYSKSYESAMLYGQAVSKILLKLRKTGYTPDVIIAHPGWGETLFAKDIYPNTKLVHFCEYYYHSVGADAGFDPEFPMNIDMAASLRARNALHLLNLENCDIGITPTRWQHSLHPAAYQQKIKIIHEGIAAQIVPPNSDIEMEMPNGTTIRKGQEVVTYVARNLEPYRGFHSFMRALPSLLERRKNSHILIVGGDSVSYGRRPSSGKTWKEVLLSDEIVKSGRVHFLGKIPYAQYQKVLQLSSIHVYLTYPFVLSWSLLEALAMGCLVLGSDTPPVREVIENKKNGILVDFFDYEGISSKIVEALEYPHFFDSYRERAVSSSVAYDAKLGVGKYLQLLDL